MDKVSFLNSFQRFITQQDDNSCVLEFSSSTDRYMINQALRSLFLQLETLFSDYQITITKSGEHSKIQVHLRLEDALWKLK